LHAKLNFIFGKIFISFDFFLNSVTRRCIPKVSNIKKFAESQGKSAGTFEKGVDQLIQFFNAKEVRANVVEITDY